MFALKMVPVPPDCVHSTELNPEAEAGVVWAKNPKTVPTQTSASLPALTNGSGVTVRTSWSTTTGQVPEPIALKVNITNPVSRAPGV